MRICAVRDGDERAVDRVVRAAFDRKMEAELVAALRASGDGVIELVADDDGDIAGHILFSRLGTPDRCIALAPVSVVPTRQYQGIGSMLIGEGLRRAASEQWDAVFLVGDPDYYTRFGFNVATAARFETAYPKRYLLALELAKGSLRRRSGKVEFAAPFLALR